MLVLVLETSHITHTMQFDDVDEAVPAEEKSRGSISMMTYVRYFKAGGHYLVLFCVLVIFIIAEVVRLSNSKVTLIVVVYMLCCCRPALLELTCGYQSGKLVVHHVMAS